MSRLTDITGEDFIKKILEHERDFSFIRLKNFDLLNHRASYEINKYLDEEAEKGYLREKPFCFDYSEFINFRVRGFFVPNSSAYKTDFLNCYFYVSHLINMYAARSSWKGSTLEEVKTHDMDVTDAIFKNTKMFRVGIDKMKNPEEAIYENTVVGPREYDFIKNSNKIDRRNFKVNKPYVF